MNEGKKKKCVLIIGDDFAIFRGSGVHPINMHGVGMRYNKQVKGWLVTGINDEDKRIIKDWFNWVDEIIEISGTYEEWKERIKRKKCAFCGKPGAFWLKLGDFVIGYTSPTIVCEDCLEDVMKNCVYQSDKWKYTLRYNLISDVEIFRGVSRKARVLMEREMKRIEKNCKGGE